MAVANRPTASSPSVAPNSRMQYEEEVPYSSVVRVEEYRETEDPVYIRATIYVERESQKRILIGAKGSRIREIGRVSKPGRRVYAGKDRLPRVLGGLGTAIMSTSTGVITHRQAAERGIGGEVIAFVW